MVCTSKPLIFWATHCLSQPVSDQTNPVHPVSPHPLKDIAAVQASSQVKGKVLMIISLQTTTCLPHLSLSLRKKTENSIKASLVPQDQTQSLFSLPMSPFIPSYSLTPCEYFILQIQKPPSKPASVQPITRLHVFATWQLGSLSVWSQYVLFKCKLRIPKLTHFALLEENWQAVHKWSPQVIFCCTNKNPWHKAQQRWDVMLCGRAIYINIFAHDSWPRDSSLLAIPLGSRITLTSAWLTINCSC